MRRSDRQVTSRSQIDAIIRDCQVCRLALALQDDPYLVPVSFGYDGRALYFHTAGSGKKISFLQANNRVCFEFERGVRLLRLPDDPCKWTFAYESVIGYGTVAELTDAGEKIQALNQIMRQYSGSDWSFDSAALQSTRLWRIDITAMTGKRSVAKSA